jgi:hypothetical protein
MEGIKLFFKRKKKFREIKEVVTSCRPEREQVPDRLSGGA